MRRLRLLLPVVFLLLAPGLRAQVTDSVRGILVDADGRPLAGERVLLHRVVGSSGANIADTQSDAEGRFTIAVDSADDAQAMYFLAARWQGELYIGEAFRAPFGEEEHRLQVGVPGTSASALLEGTGTQGMPVTPQPAAGSPATGTSWLLFAVPVIALLGVALYFGLRARTAVPPRRRLLTELAELDLANASAPSDEYRAQRARLLEQLRQSPS